jgi:hypothetical protein
VGKRFESFGSAVENRITVDICHHLVYVDYRNTVLQLEMQLSHPNTRVEPKQKDQHGSLIA